MQEFSSSKIQHLPTSVFVGSYAAYDVVLLELFFMFLSHITMISASLFPLFIPLSQKNRHVF